MKNFLKQKWLKIIIIIVIIFIIIPTVVFGGNFVVSLIQGKTTKEAIQILAKEMDTLIGRVNILEIKQSEQEKYIICDKYYNLKQKLHWKESVEAKYEWFKTGTILDICSRTILDYKCVGSNPIIINENDLVNNLKQNYPSITIEQIREEFANAKRSNEELYINSQSEFIELESARKACDEVMANSQ